MLVMFVDVWWYALEKGRLKIHQEVPLTGFALCGFRCSTVVGTYYEL